MPPSSDGSVHFIAIPTSCDVGYKYSVRVADLFDSIFQHVFCNGSKPHCDWPPFCEHLGGNGDGIYLVVVG